MKVNDRERIFKAGRKKQFINAQEKPHKTISRLFSIKLPGQKDVAWYIWSAKRIKKKNLTTKNSLPSKVILKNWSRDQELPRQAKAKGVHHHSINLTKNV